VKGERVSRLSGKRVETTIRVSRVRGGGKREEGGLGGGLSLRSDHFLTSKREEAWQVGEKASGNFSKNLTKNHQRARKGGGKGR